MGGTVDDRGSGEGARFSIQGAQLVGNPVMRGVPVDHLRTERLRVIAGAQQVGELSIGTPGRPGVRRLGQVQPQPGRALGVDDMGGAVGRETLEFLLQQGQVDSVRQFVCRLAFVGEDPSESPFHIEDGRLQDRPVVQRGIENVLACGQRVYFESGYAPAEFELPMLGLHRHHPGEVARQHAARRLLDSTTLGSNELR